LPTPGGPRKHHVAGFVNERRGAQLANLALVDRRLEAAIELAERFHEWQVRQLQARTQVLRAPRVHLAAQQLIEKLGVARLLLGCLLQQAVDASLRSFQPRVRSVRFGLVRLASSRTSHRRTFKRRQWTDLHHRRGVLGMDQCLSLLPSAQRNASMVFWLGDHRALARSLAANGGALAAVEHFDRGSALAHPYLFAGITPRHRIAAALPGNVRSRPILRSSSSRYGYGGRPSNGCRLNRSASQRQHLFMRGAVYALIRHFPYPAVRLRIDRSARYPASRTRSFAARISRPIRPCP
jgi:hypothetical protein